MIVRASPWEGRLFACVILICAALYGLTQSRISYGDGNSYDARYYLNLAEQVAAGEELTARRPFAYRIGLPFLVGVLSPSDLTAGFRWIGLFFGLLVLRALYEFLALFLRNRRTVMALVFLLALAPIGPLRQPHFYPGLVDLPALFFVLCMLRVSSMTPRLAWRHSLLLSVLGLLGVFFRESVLLTLVAIFLGHGFELRRGLSGSLWRCPRPWPAPDFWRALAPMIVTIVGLAWTHDLVEGTGSYSFLEEPALVVGLLLDRWAIYPLAWMNAFGPLLFLALIGLTAGGLGVLRRHPVLPLYLVGIALIGALAGTHTDRLVFWAFPVVLVLAGIFFEQHPITRDRGWRRSLLFVPLLVAQACAYRVFAPIPDDTFGALFRASERPEWIVLGPYGAGANTGQMFAAYMSHEGRLILTVQYLSLFIYILIVLGALRSKPLRTSSTDAPQLDALGVVRNHR